MRKEAHFEASFLIRSCLSHDDISLFGFLGLERLSTRRIHAAGCKGNWKRKILALLHKDLQKNSIAHRQQSKSCKYQLFHMKTLDYIIFSLLRPQQYREPMRRSSKPPSNTAKISGSPFSSSTIYWTLCHRPRQWASLLQQIWSWVSPPHLFSSPAKRSVKIYRVVALFHSWAFSLCNSSALNEHLQLPASRKWFMIKFKFRVNWFLLCFM